MRWHPFSDYGPSPEEADEWFICALLVGFFMGFILAIILFT